MTAAMSMSRADRTLRKGLQRKGRWTGHAQVYDVLYMAEVQYAGRIDGAEELENGHDCSARRGPGR